MLAGFEFRLTPPSPWLSVANKQMDLTGRYMAELGLTPAARARLPVPESVVEAEPLKFQFLSWVQGENGGWEERPIGLGNRNMKAV